MDNTEPELFCRYVTKLNALSNMFLWYVHMLTDEQNGNNNVIKFHGNFKLKPSVQTVVNCCSCTHFQTPQSNNTLKIVAGRPEPDFVLTITDKKVSQEMGCCGSKKNAAGADEAAPEVQASTSRCQNPENCQGCKHCPKGADQMSEAAPAPDN
ncbi:Phosphatidate phosphatase PPAPDC1A [Orchesella cincta]|uniref:Phosphatidate phosphatase PPAPDC1A n=1 Tax=Orchesella cincta TaxID=48709 RepID=A0A1D2N2I3_ORCCI|nr:Phosphatidate phosphatase PPAPDC1A [Orchesella cincta]